MTKRVLTGITPTGSPHLGNYIGAIQPAIEQSKKPSMQSYYFLADYHALIKGRNPEHIHRSGLEITAAWLACGLDVNHAIFYRQSDVPEIMEFNWILTCMTAKGLMNRAHAYKAMVQENQNRDGLDPDQGISMGLYSYPILMAADILLFQANKVPVGKDQVQHIEMARDIAGRINHHYGVKMVLPEAIVDNKVAVLKGLDGRKMSKSYNNTIPLFCSEKQLLKQIRKIKTNALMPGERKDTENCTLFHLYSAFLDEASLLQKRNQYSAGSGWGCLKNELFDVINEHLSLKRTHYNELLAQPQVLEGILKTGAEKAREQAQPWLKEIRHAIGIRPFK